MPKKTKKTEKTEKTEKTKQETVPRQGINSLSWSIEKNITQCLIKAHEHYQKKYLGYQEKYLIYQNKYIFDEKITAKDSEYLGDLGKLENTLFEKFKVESRIVALFKLKQYINKRVIDIQKAELDYTNIQKEYSLAKLKKITQKYSLPSSYPFFAIGVMEFFRGDIKENCIDKKKLQELGVTLTCAILNLSANTLGKINSLDKNTEIFKTAIELTNIINEVQLSFPCFTNEKLNQAIIDFLNDECFVNEIDLPFIKIKNTIAEKILHQKIINFDDIESLVISLSLQNRSVLIDKATEFAEHICNYTDRNKPHEAIKEIKSFCFHLISLHEINTEEKEKITEEHLVYNFIAKCTIGETLNTIYEKLISTEIKKFQESFSDNKCDLERIENIRKSLEEYDTINDNYKLGIIEYFNKNFISKTTKNLTETPDTPKQKGKLPSNIQAQSKNIPINDFLEKLDDNFAISDAQLLYERLPNQDISKYVNKTRIKISNAIDALRIYNETEKENFLENIKLKKLFSIIYLRERKKKGVFKRLSIDIAYDFEDKYKVFCFEQVEQFRIKSTKYLHVKFFINLINQNEFVDVSTPGVTEALDSLYRGIQSSDNEQSHIPKLEKICKDKIEHLINIGVFNEDEGSNFRKNIVEDLKKFKTKSLSSVRNSKDFIKLIEVTLQKKLKTHRYYFQNKHAYKVGTAPKMTEAGSAAKAEAGSAAKAEAGSAANERPKAKTKQEYSAEQDKHINKTATGSEVQEYKDNLNKFLLELQNSREDLGIFKKGSSIACRSITKDVDYIIYINDINQCEPQSLLNEICNGIHLGEKEKGLSEKFNVEIDEHHKQIRIFLRICPSKKIDVADINIVTELLIFPSEILLPLKENYNYKDKFKHYDPITIEMSKTDKKRAYVLMKKVYSAFMGNKLSHEIISNTKLNAFLKNNIESIKNIFQYFMTNYSSLYENPWEVSFRVEVMGLNCNNFWGMLFEKVAIIKIDDINFKNLSQILRESYIQFIAFNMQIIKQNIYGEKLALDCYNIDLVLELFPSDEAIDTLCHQEEDLVKNIIKRGVYYYSDHYPQYLLSWYKGTDDNPQALNASYS